MRTRGSGWSPRTTGGEIGRGGRRGRGEGLVEFGRVLCRSGRREMASPGGAGAARRTAARRCGRGAAAARRERPAVRGADPHAAFHRVPAVALLGRPFADLLRRLAAVGSRRGGDRLPSDPAPRAARGDALRSAARGRGGGGGGRGSAPAGHIRGGGLWGGPRAPGGGALVGAAARG